MVVDDEVFNFFSSSVHGVFVLFLEFLKLAKDDSEQDVLLGNTALQTSIFRQKQKDSRGQSTKGLKDSNPQNLKDQYFQTKTERLSFKGIEYKIQWFDFEVFL